MKLFLPLLLGATMVVSAQIPSKADLKARADATVDKAKAKKGGEKSAAKAKTVTEKVAK